MTPAAFDRAKHLVEPALRDAVATLNTQLQLPVTYHLGWTDKDGAPSSTEAGKGVRSALVVLGAEAVGSDASAAIAGGVALELIHNFSLIHDDIMDNDRVRRHRPTVWDVFGIGDGILVGDAMHALAFEVLLEDTTTPHAAAATARLAQATSAMIAGQAQDIALDRGDIASLDACIEMERNKTGALLAQSVAIGAVLGGADDAAVGALETFGMALGVGFQAVDDILGIWGDSARTGKPVGNDLRAHKKSMPIAIAFDRGGDIGDEVRRSFSQPMNDSQVAELSQRLQDAGIRDEVQNIARDYLNQATAALEGVDLEVSAKQELVEIADFVLERDN